MGTKSEPDRPRAPNPPANRRQTKPTKPTRNTLDGRAHGPNLEPKKRRDSCGKKRNRAQNRTRRTRSLAAIFQRAGALDRSKKAHAESTPTGSDPKSQLPGGLKCKNRGRRKMEMGEKRGAEWGRAGFYSWAARGLGATQLRGGVFFAAGTPGFRGICSTPTETGSGSASGLRTDY